MNAAKTFADNGMYFAKSHTRNIVSLPYQVQRMVDMNITYSRPITFEQADFERFRDFIYHQTGIFFPQEKRYRLENRIKKRMRVHELVSCDEYYQLLHFDDRDQKELGELFSEVTVNETSFFRNPGHFKALEKVIVPDFQNRRIISGPLRIWSAACSTGQEPYSLAITMDRLHKQGLCRIPYKIKATDISRRVLDIARQGAYEDMRLDNISDDIRNRYFRQDGDDWQVVPRIQAKIDFGYLNLNEPFGPEKFEVVFIRNVLMYFTEEQKMKVLGKVHRALVPGGYLFLGDAETLQGLHDGFKRHKMDKSMYYQKAAE